MQLSDDREVESDKLYCLLDTRKILLFAQDRASLVGSARPGYREHLVTVGNLAAHYAGILQPGADVLETRYRARVCEAAGYLHEAMLTACDFGGIVAIADERVARVVSAVTPDCREPPPRRTELLANRIGLGGAEAQLVVLADLRHECDRLLKSLGDPEVARLWVDAGFVLLNHLHALNRTPVASRVKTVRSNLNDLDQRLKQLRL